MSDRALVVSSVVAVLAMMSAGLVTGQPSGAASETQEPSRTSWGDPDLQGMWTNSTTTPMERPAALEGKEFLTQEEWAERNPGSGFSFEEPSVAMPTGAYNDFWLEKGDLSMRTSLIVDPPNGRYPPLTPEAQERRRARVAAPGSPSTGPGSWADFGGLARCILARHAWGDATGFLQPQLPNLADSGARGDPGRDDSRCAYHSSGWASADVTIHWPVDGQLARSLGRRHARHRDDEPPQSGSPQRWTPKFGQLAKVGSRPRRRSLACHGRDGVILLN